MEREEDQGTGSAQQTEGNEESTQATDTTPPPPPVRGKRKKRLSDVADRTLTGDLYKMVADPQYGRVRATISGEHVGNDRADAETAGESIKRVAHLFHALTETRPLLFGFAFGNSAVIELGASEDEISRAAEALKAAEAEGDPTRRARMLAAALPETVLAALAARDLLEASEEDVVSAALAYGVEVTAAYKSLVRVLADEDVSLVLEVPADPEAHTVITSETAARYKEELKAVGAEETVKLTAIGLLSMADSARRQIRLHLDPELRKDPILKNRRLITARYTASAGRKIREQGLWDKQVRARFEVTRDRRGTTASVRPANFLLIDAEPRG